MSDPELTVRGLRLTAAGRRILEDVDFDLAAGSLTALMGPMGSGKSCLLAALAGRSAPGIAVEFRLARYRGRPLGQGARPALVPQRPRRGAGAPAPAEGAAVLAAIAAAAATGEVLCIDEPTAGLDATAAAEVMAALRAASRAAAVLVVSHNAAEVAAHCSHVALCGGGRILVQAAAASFFGGGAGPHAAHFLRTGGLDLPRADTPAGHLDPARRALPEGIDPTPAPRGTGPVPVLAGRLVIARDSDPAGADAATTVVTVLPEGLAVRRATGATDLVPWPAARRPPDGDLATLIALCRRFDDLVREAPCVALVADRNPAGAAALLGGFLVLRGVPPDRAGAIAAGKLPHLAFGTRLERLFWDIDLALALG